MKAGIVEEKQEFGEREGARENKYGSWYINELIEYPLNRLQGVFIVKVFEGRGREKDFTRIFRNYRETR